MNKQNFIKFLVSFCIYIFLFPLFLGGYILRKYDELFIKK